LNDVLQNCKTRAGTTEKGRQRCLVLLMGSRGHQFARVLIATVVSRVQGRLFFLVESHAPDRRRSAEGEERKLQTPGEDYSPGEILIR
jgi:hypothetical protein